MVQETRLFPSRAVCLVLAVALAAPLYAAPAEDTAAAEATAIQETTALAEDFLRAFAARDFERVRGMLAPGARLQWAWLGDEKMELESFDVDGWLANVTEATAHLDELAVEILGSNALAFDDGVSVSIRFRMLGAVGGTRFVNDGVDTFSFARVDDRWRIVLSNSIEKLEMVRPGK